MLSNAVTNIDSVTTYKQYIQKAVECGMKAIAFSEHGNIFEWVHKKDACDAAGLKYIHAMEAYLTERIPEEGEERVRDNYHCILIARNWDGVKELNKMQSKAFNRTDGHYYYAPRITFDELFASSENIIVCTACIASALSKGTETAKQKFLNFLLDNKERCFLEVQHHNTDSQRNYNRYLANLSKETGLRLIAATDTHCLNKEHELGRSVLQVSKNTKFDGEDGWDLIWKDYDQLISAFQVQGALTEEEYMTAIQNTNVMADMIEDFTLDRSFKYAKVYDNGEEILRKKLFAPDVINSIVAEGFKREDVEARLEHELDTFKALGATDFILLEDHIIQWEHSHDIWQGPARGSAASSLALYALGITEVNPLKYGFYFWRFMDKSKYSLADIDVDNAPEDRDRVKEWMLNDHLDLPNVKTCEIITFHTEALKGAIRDVGRGLGMPLYEVDEIAKAVHDVSVDENKMTVIDDEWRERYPELFKIVDIVLGTVTSIGSHASGVVISDRDIEEEFGTCYLKDDPYPVSCINMKELDSLNFTKQDALGLENIGVINGTCKLAGIDRVSPKTINFEDDAVWDSMRKDTALIFQMNSDYGQRTMSKIFSDEVFAKIKKEIPSMTKLDLLSFACALVRPCGKGVYEKATNGIVSKTGIREIDDLLGPSMGYAIMQEPQMAFVQQFCGYSFLESDKLRKCVARGEKVLMGDGSLKNIEDVKVGDIVATKDGNRISARPVTAWSNNGIKKTIKVRCDCGYNIQCTKDHRILTQRGYVEAKDLVAGDFVYTPKVLQPNEDGLRSHQKPSNDVLWMLGALIGDGTIGEKERLCLTNSDVSIIEKFKNAVKQTRRAGEPEFRVSYVDGKTVDKIYRAHISSGPFKDAVWNLILSFNMNHKAAQKEIPKQIQTYSPTEKLASFLAGLFNTDGGYCTNRKCIEYYTISEKLIWQLWRQLLKFRIYSSISEKNVSGYGYKSYVLSICDKVSLRNFNAYIMPYIVGIKRTELQRMIDINNSYCYFLPPICKEEALKSCKAMSGSTRDVLLKLFGKEYELTNGYPINIETARLLVSELYMPYTHKLLTGDFITQRVMDIQDSEECETYDIEVEQTHNFICEGIVVHNCISKKYGTREQLPKIKKMWEENAKIRYNLTDEQSEAIIEPFLQCILDATRYSFSLVHSLSYSCISYECGWLRYHYPLEYITSCLNTWNGNDEKTAEAIEYATKKGIRILLPKFRHSKADYFFDKETNSIYRGTSSVKGISASYAEALYELRDREYNSFIELLYDIQTIGVPKDQIEALIKLDYFEEFGTIKELSLIYYQFQCFKKGEAKTISKDKLTDKIIYDIVARNANETAKQFNKINCRNILIEIEQYIKSLSLGDADIKTKIQNQMDYMGYIGIKTDKLEDRPRIIVLSIRVLKSAKTNKPWAISIDGQSIGSAKRANYTIRYSLYEKEQFNKCDIIRIKDWERDKRGYYWITNFVKEIC